MATMQHTGSARMTAGTRTRSAAMSTEARPALLTTEFWVGAVASIGVVVAGYLDDALDVDLAWILFSAITAAYLISRGIAKAGSGESYVGPLPDTDGDRS